MASTIDEDHEIVKISTKPFPSIPLFLPDDVEYDPETNAIRAKPNEDPQREAPRLVLTPNAGMEMLATMTPKNAPVSMISCVGPYRTGKSLLVSRFLENSNTFRIGPTLEGCTRGIWISTSAIKQKSTGVYKILLDCEGLGDPLSATGAEATATNDARIALACVLLSSVFVYNATSHPDRGSLTFLRYLDTVRKRLPEATRSKVKYPSFLWVFRDFFLQLPPRPDDPTRKYTLQEYVSEKVLNVHHSGNEQEVVESLLNDFAAFDVLSIGYPQRKQGLPFTVEEMSMLGEVPWNEFEETFQRDMNTIIQHCLGKADTPFTLVGSNNEDTSDAEKTAWNKWWGSKKSSDSKYSKLGNYAHPAIIAKWCETCVELVNSEGVIPNLPDLQHQLLKSMAEEQLAKCIEDYKTAVQTYVDELDVYNRGGNGGTTIDTKTTDGKPVTLTIEFKMESLANELGLKGVAETDALLKFSARTSEILQAKLAETIPSPSILKDTMERYESQCHDSSIKTSVLSQIQQVNHQRSKTACEALAQKIYAPIREIIRDEPTKVSVYDFETKILEDVVNFFRERARGPALEETLLRFLKEPGDADAIFLTTVQERQVLLNHALEAQANLEQDILAKKADLESMKDDLDKTKKQNEAELAAIKAQHEQTMARAIEEQKKQEEEQLAALEAKMRTSLNEANLSLKNKEEQRLRDLEALREESSRTLKVEVESRELKIKAGEEAHKAEIEKLKAEADLKLQEERKLAQQQLIEEQEKIIKETEAKLAKAEAKMRDEVGKKEDQLMDAQKVIAEKQQSNIELLQRAESAESQACPIGCCCQ